MLLSDLLSLGVIAVSIRFTHASRDKLIKATALVLEEVQRVVLHARVDPSLVHVLLRQETRHFVCVCPLGRLLIVLRQICLPVCVDEVVGQRLKRLNLAIWPLIKVHRLDLSDVYPQTTVLT